MLWTRCEWAEWGMKHPWTLLITPVLILALYAYSKLSNR